jgi:Tfp pilus assembly protein PilF
MTLRKSWIGAVFILATALLLPLLRSRAQSSRSDFPESRLQLAVSYYNSGRLQEAARVLEGLLKQTPAKFEVEELLGLVYASESKDQEAYLHLEKAVRLKPDSAPTRANLAVNLARLGENTLGEAEFKKAIQAELGNFSANHNFGEFYVRAGKIKEAIPCLRRARRAQRAKPSSYGNGYDLALAYVEVGVLTEALRQIQDLLKVRDTAEMHGLLGEVEEKSENTWQRQTSTSWPCTWIPANHIF